MKNVIRLFCSLMLLGAVAAPAPSLAADRIASPPVDQADGQQALDVLRQLLAAYIKGQYLQSEALVEPQMIGHAQITEALRLGATRQKQMRINLSDTRTLVSEDVVIIRTRWEKRFLSVPGLRARRSSGDSTFVMHRESGVWRLSAASGDALISAD
jgi:hypothetical protein